MKIDNVVVEPGMVAAYVKWGPRKRSIAVQVGSEPIENGGPRSVLRGNEGRAGRLRERGPPGDGGGPGPIELFGVVAQVSGPAE